MPPRRRNAKTSASRSRKQPPSDTSIVGVAPEQKEMEVEIGTSAAEEAATRIPEGEVVEEEKQQEVMEGQEQEQEKEREQEQETVEEEEVQESNEAPQTLEERTEKLKLLRQRMRQSAQANRTDLILESQRTKSVARELARQEKERKLHELLRLKAEADDRGEDMERAKNWQYTIEENDAWEKRLKRKKTRADFEFHDDAHAARRKYKKDLDLIKPDLEAYNAQKAAAIGTSSEGDGVQTVSVQQQLAVESLYRDANTLLYADHKPSEDAIDRVISKLNLDLDKRSKRSRKRPNQEEGDITYINERNRVFNKKIARYYDKYTAEIRASFERGTAL